MQSLRSGCGTMGPQLLEFERQMGHRTRRTHAIGVNSGSLAIEISLRALGIGIGDEVLVSAFGYSANVNSILHVGAKPIFVDIDPEHLTIDESKIEDAITSKTTSILATHVFGNPCNVEVIESIAKKHNLSVIYDAAHCFGVNYKDQSIFNYGDVSTCSFHATKIFHTAEGGAMFCNDEKLYHKLYYSHNFGHNGPLEFHGLGINAKISEFFIKNNISLLKK